MVIRDSTLLEFLTPSVNTPLKHYKGAFTLGVKDFGVKHLNLFTTKVLC
jgi:hypothetical protein